MVPHRRQHGAVRIVDGLCRAVVQNVLEKSSHPDPAQHTVSVGSGAIAVRGQTFAEPNAPSPSHLGAAVRGVVFHRPAGGRAFFTAATQSWPDCSNRQYSDIRSDSVDVWPVGPGLQHERHPQRHAHKHYSEGRLDLRTGADRSQQRCRRSPDMQYRGAFRRSGQHRPSDRHESGYQLATFPRVAPQAWRTASWASCTREVRPSLA